MNGTKTLNLVREIAITGFKLKYNGSIFGYLWSLMNPLFYFLILYVVFAKIFKIGGSVENYPLYLLIGITLWGFFIDTTSSCMTSIVGSGDLIRKVYFPRAILPIASSITSFISLLLNLIVVFGFVYYLNIDINVNVLLLPLILLEFYLLSLGVSFFLASLFVRFRDIGHIWALFVQALFYATPILYPISFIPDKSIKIVMISPIAQIIQDARSVLLSSNVETSGQILGSYWFIPYMLVIIICLSGYFVFNKMSAKFAEEV